MPPIVVFIHTINGLKDQFESLAGEYLPECRRYHIADETLIYRLLDAGGLTPPVFRRVCDHVTAAAEAGAAYIQLTCSSISPCVEAAGQMVSVPVLAIDDAMIRQAVSQYRRIGVIATNPATLVPSTERVRTTARELAREVEVLSVLCEGAYQAFLTGDRETHDRIVMAHLLRLLEQVDAVCLAQASMARIADQVPSASGHPPIYSNPRPAMQRLGELMRTGR